MFDRLIDWALRSRPLVLLLLVGLVLWGANSLVKLPIDAQPDITNVQVMALTSAPGLGPVEIEQFITIPVENSMNGIPMISEVRSFSQFGLSGVTIVFQEGTDIYWARQQVGERLAEVRSSIPPEFGQPEMGPISTGLGEVFQFEVKNAPDAARPRSLMELRTILDWEIARPLKSVPGVVEVNAFGGELKTYEVRLDPDRLMARNISVDKVFEAIRRNNSNAGGGYLERLGEQRVIRAVGLISTLKDLEEVVLDTTATGTPVYIRDVAEVRLSPLIRNGAVTRDGDGEVVTATAMMLAGENSRVVVERIKAKLEEIRTRLPEGVVVDPYYDRAVLITRTITTVASNLAEGGLLVVAVLLAMLGNLKAGLVVALAIPLSMLFAINLMVYYGIAGSLMSLGAIDFGLIVDSSVIMMENCVSHLSHADKRRSAVDVVREAAFEVRKPVVFGVAIITIVHLPLLALEGVEGKMFRPMALTVVFALIGSLILSLTATPVLASLILKPGTSEVETLPVRVAKRVYRPFLRFSLDHPIMVVATSLVAFAATMPLAMSLGGEFIPKLDEGDILVVVTRPPSTSLSESLEDSTRLEKALRESFPDEIESVVCRTGRPEIGIDPAGVNQTDVFVFLKKEEETYLDMALKPLHPLLALFEGEGHGKSKSELIAEMEKVFRRELPGAFFNFGQPIDVRFNEMLAGVRADLGIGLYGDDLDVLQEKVNAIAAAIENIPGAADVRAQVLGGLPFLRVQINREDIARYGINAASILDVVSALGGKVVGQVIEGQRTFDLQVRFDPTARDDVDSITRLKIADANGRMIPLSELAEFHREDGAYEIWRKDRQRRAMVQANVRERDLATFVAEAQAKVAEQVELPRGYFLEWGGTFQNLQSATQRLTVVVPVALVLIFLLLYGTFQSVKLGTLIFLSVPLGAMGGILALWLRDMNLSISAGVGFIALSGVAVLDGLVIVSAIRQRVENGEPIRRAVAEASMSRLRPVLMTALVASLGFIPMAFSTGSGADVQRPLATVVIGGLITSTGLKLLVIPATYAWFDPGRGRLAADVDALVEDDEDDDDLEDGIS
ncbi:efflux RND transporter permease subunit [Planctomyces sp. SH-PL62]|uniref:efflux RND transporter permease subunit n=1 Tax=Planctomyces sp. SH-PL62 TaxID=1636152 RepID=UPI00078EDB33|nr:CusA/CzcA family heavy metal efflux RND transporter [Planctomyces sp. SH-PL62]AMV36635.1 Cobalt-zinc-cadmium resistance protein CzcA [Planctomyces sp. SH-PL62]